MIITSHLLHSPSLLWRITLILRKVIADYFSSKLHSILEEFIMERILVQIDLDHRNADVESLQEKANLAMEQAVSDISADIRKMINNCDYNDVVFQCSNGVRVYASRLFLVARSVVFHRMLQNGMAESQLSEITLQEISSTAFLPVMEFLYTGTIQEHAPTGWENACEVIVASRFFLLEGLELHMVNFLLRSVAQVGVDLEAAAKCLSITLEFAGILGENVKPIARELVHILECRSLKQEHLRALTSNAFMYLLQETTAKVKEPQYMSQEEFLRFKNIVLWCACEEFASNEPLMLQSIPSGLESTLELLERPPVQRELMACEWSQLDLTIRKALASSVKEYLPLVNFRRISPRLLVHVVEPMDIIPSSVIIDALRYHALRRPCSIEAGTVGWSSSFKNHEIFRMSRSTGGSVINKTAMGIGFARYSLAMNREDGDQIYEWEIIIEEVCDEFIEIGLHNDRGGNFNPQESRSLSRQPGGWVLRMDAQGITVNRKRTSLFHFGFVRFGRDCSRLTYGVDYGRKNSKINISLNLFKGSCCFTVDNENPTLAWSQLSEGTFFPAVSLGSGSSGGVQMNVLSHT